MSNQDDPLNTPAPRPEDEDVDITGTVSAFALTAGREHVKAGHAGTFEECNEPDCLQARNMLDGIA